MSVNMVPGGSLEVVFKSGLGVGLSSFVGFGTTWELVWVPLGGKGALESVTRETVGSLEVVLRSGVKAGPISMLGFRIT